MTEVIARGRCILRNLPRSFLRNRPVRKVAQTKESVAIPKGRTRENNEKELLCWCSWPVSSAAKALSLTASPIKISAGRISNKYDLISAIPFVKISQKVQFFPAGSCWVPLLPAFCKMGFSLTAGSSMPASISSSASFCWLSVTALSYRN